MLNQHPEGENGRVSVRGRALHTHSENHRLDFQAAAALTATSVAQIQTINSGNCKANTGAGFQFHCVRNQRVKLGRGGGKVPGSALAVVTVDLFGKKDPLKQQLWRALYI